MAGIHRISPIRLAAHNRPGRHLPERRGGNSPAQDDREYFNYLLEFHAPVASTSTRFINVTVDDDGFKQLRWTDKIIRRGECLLICSRESLPHCPVTGSSTIENQQEDTVKTDPDLSSIDPVGKAEVLSPGCGLLPRTILLVEDDRVSTMVESKVLSVGGYEVLSAHSGEEALDVVKSDQHVALVLMDINLGEGMEGTEAAKQILAVRDLPVIFLTSHAEQEIVERVRGITRYGYVLKNSGDYVLLSSIEMAFELFDAREKAERNRQEMERHRDKLAVQGEELRLSREEYRDLYDMAPVGYFTLSLDEVITRANLTAAAMLGVKRDDLAGQVLSTYVEKSDELIYYTHLKRLIATGTPQGCEVRMKLEGGSFLWVSLHATAVRSGDGEITSSRVALIDIARRKEAEEALLLMKKRNDLILASAGEGIYGLDHEGRATFINPAAAWMLGYGASELEGSLMHEKIHHTKPDGSPYPADECPINAAITDGTVHFVDTELFWHKDGSSFPAEYTGTPMRDEHNNVVGAVVVFQDITERNEAQEELQKSEERYRSLFERSRDAIMILEPPSWKFTAGNQSTLDMFKTGSEEEFLSFDPWMLSPEYQPDGRLSSEKAAEMIEKALQEGSHFFEWTHRRTTGDEFKSTVLLSRVEQGTMVYLQATVRDIT